MARISGINIPPHQHAEIGLTAIFGIGRARARAILDAVRIPHSKKVKDLTDGELERLVADNLATYKQLRHVVVVDAVPRLPSGKVLRRTLRDEWAPTLAGQAAR